MRSGIRDFLCLLVFGLLAGALLGTDSVDNPPREKRGLIAVPCAALGFALFHGLQYYLAFPALDQSIRTFPQALWLFCAGAWFGFIYFLMRPAFKNGNPLRGVLLFSFGIVGYESLAARSGGKPISLKAR
jgi:hypothetical protein